MNEQKIYFKSLIWNLLPIYECIRILHLAPKPSDLYFESIKWQLIFMFINNFVCKDYFTWQ